MRVLVTGSSGFMGLALSEAISDAGYEVVGFDMKPPPFPDLAWMDKFTFVQGNIGDILSFSGNFKRIGITHVIHAAAITPSPDRERETPDIIAAVNIVGAYRVMLMAADVRPERVVYLSSISAYGPAIAEKNGRYDEHATHAVPEALYGISKLAAEQGMKRIAQMNEVDLRTVRLGWACIRSMGAFVGGSGYPEPSPSGGPGRQGRQTLHTAEAVSCRLDLLP